MRCGGPPGHIHTQGCQVKYFDELSKEAKNVIKELERRGVKEQHLAFGGAGAQPIKEPRTPTDARSEFLANRAMGDWAEDLLASSLRNAIPEWQVVHFGETASIAAGEEGFQEHYRNGIKEVRKHGKRPDLLIFERSKGIDVSDDISKQPFEQIDELPEKAIGSIEVRSSKFEALKYMKERAKDKEQKKAAARECPSFTVKVEDLVIVYRWLERKKIPQAYFQVFFDSVFAINFLDIFTHIAAWSKGVAIESPAKSQEKATLMIPITYGKQVARMTKMPIFTAETRITRLGRHDAFVKPQGGELLIDITNVKTVIGV
ncbi:hypothetical protein C8235_03535 [Paracidovorax avenae]|nr:hypothetical protein C8235_03535 [Paracidovorax avenae]